MTRLHGLAADEDIAARRSRPGQASPASLTSPALQPVTIMRSRPAPPP